MCSFSQSSRLVPARRDMCLVVSGSLREMFLHAMLKYESPAFIVELIFHTFLLSLHLALFFDQIFGIRLGAFEMCYILVH